MSGWNKWAAVLAVMVLLVAGLSLRGAPAQDTTFINNGVAFSGYQICYPTSQTKTIALYQYGPVIDCRRARQVVVAVLTSGHAGAGTTSTVEMVEWLLDDPSAPQATGPYGGITYTAGWNLPSTVWSVRERLMLVKSATTTAAPTTATASIISDGNWIATVTPKGPYFRFCTYNTEAAVTTNEGKVTAWYALRYAEAPQAGVLRKGYGDGANLEWVQP
jgi:hypothetical protein